MTTATEIGIPPIIAKLITLIAESDDDGTINGFLALFDVEPELIPIEHLVTDVALAVDEDGRNWLAGNEFTDSIATLVNLIAKDPTRIPAVDVHTALRSALVCDDEGSAIAFLTDVALLIPATIAPFPQDILDSMITYGERENMWEVRLAVVMTLAALGRGAECAMYIDDEDHDVASEAVSSLPHTPETRALLEKLLDDEDLHEDVALADVPEIGQAREAINGYSNAVRSAVANPAAASESVLIAARARAVSALGRLRSLLEGASDF